MTDLASVAAATAAGYQRTRVDYGSTTDAQNRYVTRFTKPMVGGSGQQGRLLEAEAASATSAAQADTNALAALNAQRAHRYAFGATAGTDGHGAALTFDVS